MELERHAHDVARSVLRRNWCLVFITVLVELDFLVTVFYDNAEKLVALLSKLIRWLVRSVGYTPRFRVAVCSQLCTENKVILLHA